MRWLVLALVILQSATCGQKGPLTLPEDGNGGPDAPPAAGVVAP
ncbi:MAG TPA: lipoprotein [Pseudomonadales bacterium]